MLTYPISSFLDIDECSAIAGLCVGGTCVNTIGSFRCDCGPDKVKNPRTNVCESMQKKLILVSQKVKLSSSVLWTIIGCYSVDKQAKECL